MNWNWEYNLISYNTLFTLTFLFVFHKVCANVQSRYFCKPGFWFVYWPKYVFHVISIFIWKKRLRVRLNKMKDDDYYGNVRIVPTQSEIDLEEPKFLVTDRHEDSIAMWAGDVDGRTIYVKVSRLTRRRSFVMLFVKNERGHIFTLPGQPDSLIVNVDSEKSWRGEGVNIECVHPMSLWRFTFNGVLRKDVNNSYVPVKKQEENAEFFHVKINMIIRALKPSVDLWKDSSSWLLGHALANETDFSYDAFRELQRDGYDQWGALHGTVEIEKQPVQTWYLRGCRQHRWGLCDSALNLRKSLVVNSYFENGDILWLEAFSVVSGIQQCVRGYFHTAVGHYHPITWCSLNLLDYDDSNPIDKDLFFQIKISASEDIIHVWSHFCDKVPHYTGDPWSLEQTVCISITASTSSGSGWGVVILTEKYTQPYEMPSKRYFNLPELPKETEMSQSGIPNKKKEFGLPMVLSLEDLRALDVKLSGGKGASLVNLKHIEKITTSEDVEFSVPNGVIITSNAWSKHLEDKKEISNHINNLQKLYSCQNIEKMKDLCKITEKVVSDSILSDETENIFEEKLKVVFGEDFKTKRFAVRSSASGEDSESSSAAGQHKTFLNCKWNNSSVNSGNDLNSNSKNSSMSKWILSESKDTFCIRRAIIYCWASQFCFECVEYKRQRGQIINDSMAVIVQEIVDPDGSGVLFTADSVSANPMFFTITANYGLGESVVSASADPDTIIVKRSVSDEFSIQSKTIGAKMLKFVSNVHSSGIKEISNAFEDRKSVCLNDSLSLKLAKVAALIQKYYGSHRDIEFAVKGEKIYVLQARPLTFLNDWTDYELIHEFDSAVKSDSEIMTTANVSEVITSHTNPLTVSTILKMIDLASQTNMNSVQCKRTFDANTTHNMPVFMCRLFLNVAEVFYRNALKELTVQQYSFDLAIFGRPFTDDQILNWTQKRHRFSTWSFIVFINILKFFYLMFTCASEVLSQPMKEYTIDSSKATEAKDLYQIISCKLKDYSESMFQHLCSSGSSSVFQAFTLMALNGSNKASEIKESSLKDITTILSNISGAESAQVPNYLANLSEQIYENNEIVEFLQMNSEEAKVWLETHPGPVGSAYRKFMQKHGHRCVDEFDLRAISWSMDPTPLVSTLQSLVKNPSSFRNAKKCEKSVDTLMKNLDTQFTGFRRHLLEYFIKKLNASVIAREATKSYSIKVVDAFRKSFRSLGQMMFSEGRLPDEGLIFFLTHREIGILLENRSADLVLKATKRRRIAEKLKDLKFDEISYGVPKPLTEDTSLAQYHCENDSKIYKGTPVCMGTITGRVRVAKNIHEANLIQHGEILITHSTDVGWSPYFPLLSGIVTEIGGLISHGAVVAREYGLPCIIGIKNASEVFKSGDLVLLNAKEGYIQKI